MIIIKCAYNRGNTVCIRDNESGDYNRCFLNSRDLIMTLSRFILTFLIISTLPGIAGNYYALLLYYCFSLASSSKSHF